MGIDDKSSHPEVCSGVADGVTRNIVCLFREPDAVTPPVRFDKRGCGNVAWCGFQGTPSRYTGSSCSLGFDGDKFVAQWFGLPFEFCFQPFLPLGISGGPQRLVIFDLIFDHGVKDHCDLVGGCHGGSLGAQLGFHAAQVVA